MKPHQLICASTLVGVALFSAATPSVTAQQGTSSVRGIARDVNGGPVPDATVALKPEGQLAEQTAITDAAGVFTFSTLPAGHYRVTIVAAGLETFVSEAIDLHSGEARELPGIALAIASTTSSVQVTATVEQIADAQVTAAAKQRVFGVLPNFYTSFIYDAAPMNSRQKFVLAGKAALDPVNFLADAAIAGVEQKSNTYPGYGDDAAGYGKRYAAAFGDEAFGRLFASALYPALFRQDPRYFYKGTGSTRSRVIYAISRTLITRSNSGSNQPNYSLVLGRFTAGAIANAYHPHADRGLGLTIDNALLNIAGHSIDNLLREFLPRRLTPSVPAYENGLAGMAQAAPGKP